MTSTMGAYELDKVLGRGAMGEVRRAHRAGSDGQVAVKVLRPELADDPQLIARFLQERDVLCSLDHPNLVRVHDLVVEGGSAAIVMDLIEGTDLRRELTESGTLAPAQAGRIVAQVLAALAAVHALDIVHRDVKPENILLGHDGEVRLTDFGIARLTHGPSLTRLTGLIGTPEYLAPELAEREHATSAADVYAAGVVLYELLTGFTPFAGGHPVAVLRRHIEELPAKPEGLPDPLWHLLSSMLEKDPGRRPMAGYAASILLAMVPTLEGLAPRPLTWPVRDTQESETSLRIHFGDKTERATVFKATPAPNIGSKSRRPIRRRVVEVVTAVVVVLAGVLTFALIERGSKSPATASYAFAPESLSSGLIVDRTWTLTGGTRSVLRGRVLVTNGQPKTVKAKYDEVIPNAVTKNVGSIAFVPKPDQVIQRDPVVQYDLSLGPGASFKIRYSVRVPSFTGSPSVEVTDLAHDQSAAQTAYLSSSDLDSGNVPTTTTLPPTTTTTISQIQVPNLIGLSPQAAASQLSEQTLSVGSQSTTCSNSFPTNEVSGSSPPAGSEVGRNSQVNLIISSGTCQVVVQPVVGESSGQATSDLQGQGLTVSVASSVICDPSNNGNVVAQSPPGGTPLTLPATDTITVCNAPADTTATTVPQAP